MAIDAISLANGSTTRSSVVWASRDVAESLEALRQRYPRFSYRAYHAVVGDSSVTFEADFAVEPDICFQPRVTIPFADAARLKALGQPVLDNLAFHLGLMEIPSYWKATCSPRIVVAAGRLDQTQRAWWHDLLLNGMGEFFFTNAIDFTAPDFVVLESASDVAHAPLVDGALDPNRILVPIGGGKDSAVTAEILGDSGRERTAWLLNPTPAARDVARASGIDRAVVLSRQIDPRLLELNRQGYLNGHTPFSAYLAFASVASAILNGPGRIAVSNERSSNEGNTLFHGREVNHQYSKTFTFEAAFRRYSRAYLASDVDYFSFMRPLYELQIAKLFSGHGKYFAVFRSCNRGQKTNSWCGACPKCLFVYVCLYPFLDEELSAIFAEDLFAKEELVETALELVGARPVKPFECVGCRAESVAAFQLCFEKARRSGPSLPPVLRAVDAALSLADPRHTAASAALLASWNAENAVPDDLAALLQRRVFDR